MRFLFYLDYGLTFVGESFFGTFDPEINNIPPPLEYYAPNPFLFDDSSYVAENLRGAVGTYVHERITNSIVESGAGQTALQAARDAEVVYNHGMAAHRAGRSFMRALSFYLLVTAGAGGGVMALIRLYGRPTSGSVGKRPVEGFDLKEID